MYVCVYVFFDIVCVYVIKLVNMQKKHIIGQDYIKDPLSILFISLDFLDCYLG